jgi:hypothetical protein
MSSHSLRSQWVILLEIASTHIFQMGDGGTFSWWCILLHREWNRDEEDTVPLVAVTGPDKQPGEVY